MKPVNIIKTLVATSVLTLSAPAFSADIIKNIWLQDFDGGAGTDTSLQLGDYIASNKGSKNWRIHHESTNCCANTGLSGKVVGHVGNTSNDGGGLGNSLYSGDEQSIYSAEINISDFKTFDEMYLMFDYAGQIHDGMRGSRWGDGASLTTSSGSLLSSTTGSSAFDLQNPMSGFGYVGIDDDSHLDDAQFGGADAHTMGYNPDNGAELGGSAMFNLSDLIGLNDFTFRLAFGSDNASGTSSSGINFDNFKLYAVCKMGNKDCGNGGGETPVPEPASLSLAMLGMAALYRRRKKAC